MEQTKLIEEVKSLVAKLDEEIREEDRLLNLFIEEKSELPIKINERPYRRRKASGGNKQEDDKAEKHEKGHRRHHHHKRKTSEEKKEGEEKPEKPEKGNRRPYHKRKVSGENEQEGEETEKPEKKRDEFTHFFSLPLHTIEFKQKATELMNSILSKMDTSTHRCMRKQNLDQVHLTLSMLALKDEEMRQKVANAFKAKEDDINALFKDGPFNLTFEGVGAFWERGHGKKRIPRVIFLELKHDENIEKLNKLCHTLISEMMTNDVIKQEGLRRANIIMHKESQTYRPENFHVTLFRVKKGRNRDLDNVNFKDILKECEKFAFGTFPIKRVDVSTRFKFDTDKFYMPLSTISLKEQMIQIEEQQTIA